MQAVLFIYMPDMQIWSGKGRGVMSRGEKVTKWVSRLGCAPFMHVGTTVGCTGLPGAGHGIFPSEYRYVSAVARGYGMVSQNRID